MASKRAAKDMLCIVEPLWAQSLCADTIGNPRRIRTACALPRSCDRKICIMR